MKMFLVTHWKGILCAVVPIILIPICFSFPTKKYQWCGYTLLIMAIYWVSECIPLAVTAFLPIVIFPISGVMNTVETCGCYMNNTIMMFIGSLYLASAVEQSGLHMRLALLAIRLLGYSHYRLLFAMSTVTMLISMWITNTAATTMMVPINFALLKVFEEQKLLTLYEQDINGEMVASDKSTCYFCAATFSATVGGIGTLVGTATNLVFKGLFVKQFPKAPEYLSFPNYSAFTVPLMLAMGLATYFCMCVMYFGFLRPNSEVAKRSHITKEAKQAAKEKVEENLRKLGPITFWETEVILLFAFAIFLFFCRAPQIFLGWADRLREYYGIEDTKFILDSATAILVSFLMLLFPYSMDVLKNFEAETYEELTKHRIKSVLDWASMTQKLPYSFMFLLGGGFALSKAAKPEYTNLNGEISKFLKLTSSLPNAVVMLLIIIFTTFVTNFASNVVVCTVIAPIVMELAKTIQQNPLWYDLAAGLSASYCFCIPVGTPGNLIVQSAANIPTQKMIRAGLGPSIASILLTWFALYFYAPIIWPDLYKLPDWING